MIHPVALFRGSCVLCARDGKILNWRDKNRQNSKQLTTEVSEDQRLILRFILYKLTFFSDLSSTDSYIKLLFMPRITFKMRRVINKKNLSKLIVSSIRNVISQRRVVFATVRACKTDFLYFCFLNLMLKQCSNSVDNSRL